MPSLSAFSAWHLGQIIPQSPFAYSVPHLSWHLAHSNKSLAFPLAASYMRENIRPCCLHSSILTQTAPTSVGLTVTCISWLHCGHSGTLLTPNLNLLHNPGMKH